MSCPHTPPCPRPEAPDAAAARITADHLQDSGYALLCNGCLLLEGEELLLPAQRARAETAARS